ncbi:hypothetical protein [Citrobacter youngae]|uniref:Uncharacterized protein n=1 Tax=Citrobacter youngae ATCC 29220 TaxID=500640 RepID=D4BKE8_9ENTR|nr:hypothetical protein [Citrobacter youngae]EFE05579.1 hypothetical protein CIT292_11025 [Citrobacter youngae ATCC 29220]
MKVTEKFFPVPTNTDQPAIPLFMNSQRMIVLRPTSSALLAQKTKVINNNHSRNFHHIAEVIHTAVLLTSAVAAFSQLASNSNADDAGEDAGDIQSEEPTMEPAISPPADVCGEGPQPLLSACNESQQPVQPLHATTNATLEVAHASPEDGNNAGYDRPLPDESNNHLSESSANKTAAPLSPVPETHSATASPALSAHAPSNSGPSPDLAANKQVLKANTHAIYYSVARNAASDISPKGSIEPVRATIAQKQECINQEKNTPHPVAAYQLVCPLSHRPFTVNRMSRQEKNQYDHICHVLNQSYVMTTGMKNHIFQPSEKHSLANRDYYAANSLSTTESINTRTSSRFHSQSGDTEENILPSIQAMAEPRLAKSPLMINDQPFQKSEKVPDLHKAENMPKTPSHQYIAPQSAEQEMSPYRYIPSSLSKNDFNATIIKNTNNLSSRELLQQRMTVLVMHSAFLDSGNEKKARQSPVSLTLCLVFLTLSLLVAFLH